VAWPKSPPTGPQSAKNLAKPWDTFEPGPIWTGALKGMQPERKPSFLSLEESLRSSGMEKELNRLLGEVKPEVRDAILTSKLGASEILALIIERQAHWSRGTTPLAHDRIVELFKQEGRLDLLERAKQTASREQVRELEAGRMSGAEVTALVREHELHHEMDILYIGGGAAGIGGAREAEKLGLKPLILEYEANLGGRVKTVVSKAGEVFDVGAAWLMNWAIHPLTPFALKSGFHLVEDGQVTVPHMQGALRPDLAEPYAKAYERLLDLARKGLQSGWTHLSQVMPSDALSKFASRIFTRELGKEPKDLKLSDVVNDGGVTVERNVNVEEGFGRLLSTWGKGVPALTQTKVKEVVQLPDGKVKVVADRNGREEIFFAKEVVLTVAPTALKKIRMGFPPGSGGEQALKTFLEGVQMADAYKKVQLTLDKSVLDLDPRLREAWDGRGLWIPTDKGYDLYVPPHDPRQVVLITSGNAAAAIEGRGPLNQIETERFATDFVQSVLGADAKPIDIQMNKWIQEKEGGSYSAGSAEVRSALAALNQEPGLHLKFAGEALSLENFGSVHGAIATGVEATRRAAGILPG
jgi:monoamine oxidase